jgi:DNA-directed RNA polymerase subunit RPC12/RpoP
MQMFQMLHRTMNDRKPLRITCQDCSHQVFWDRATAIARCGPDATPLGLHNRLRCGDCGSRHVLCEL